MLPNRSDYKNKKDYKWARKQAQREEIRDGTGIASARGWASFLTFFALGLGFQALGFEGWGTALALVVAVVVFRRVPPAPIIQEQIDANKREEQERGPKWKKGTKVTTALGLAGTVKKEVADRPGYFHVGFDDGTMSQIRQVSKQHLEDEKQSAPVATPQAPLTSTTAELQRLADLHQEGSLTAEEFQAAKAKVLAK
jgi:preprotein translocase subunit YajC